ncbi:MAG: LysM peptidoglycan-binding domain-containing protein [Granulosicoccus sp.]
MIRTTSTRSLPLIVVLTLSLTSCATTQQPALQQAPSPTVQEIEYQVKPGDQLGSIAERFTGQFGDWAVIAAYNDIADPRTLAVGQTLRIPPELVQSSSEPSDGTDSDSAVENTTPLGGPSVSPVSVTTGNGVSVVGSRNEAAESNDSITVAPVEVNRTFDLQRIDDPLPVSDSERGVDPATPYIKVRGSYYPKGVYREPADYARLMQRAAPGTVFPLESKVDVWYKIITNEGIGYIRQSDSILVD